MLLAQPISRAKLLWSHALVAVGGLALLSMAVWVGIAVGVMLTTVDETVPSPSVEVPLFGWNIPMSFAEPATESFPLSERVDARAFGAATFNLFSFGFFLLGLSTLLSSLDRYRWRTIGLVMTCYVLQLVMFGLGKAAESLSWLEGMTFFNCYRPQALSSLVADGGLSAPWSLTTVMPDSVFPPLVYPMILIGLGCVCYVTAARVFTRRDLPAPL